MKSTQHRSAWILLAVAAMMVTTLARTEAGSATASAYAHHAFALLTGHPTSSSLASRSVPRILKGWSAQHVATSTQDRNTGVWQAMLPVLFIGLVAPLSVAAIRSTASTQQIPSEAALPSTFQRPPPALLA